MLFKGLPISIFVQQFTLFGEPEKHIVLPTLETLTALDVARATLGERLVKQKISPNYKSLCPIHEEKNPSFFVKPNKDFWICYGCAHYGGPMLLLHWLDWSSVYQQDPYRALLAYKIDFTEPSVKEMYADLLRTERARYR